MKRVVVLAPATDSHAKVVVGALRAAHAEVWQLDTLQQPEALSVSCSEAGLLEMVGAPWGVPAAAIDTLWLRRPVSAPWKIGEGRAKASIRDIESEFHRFAVLGGLAQASRLCVNPFQAMMAMEWKLEGLRHAALAGFRTPATLMSSEPDAIEAFFDTHDGRVVYKPHRQHKPAGGGMLGTLPLSRSHLQGWHGADASPGIFQELLDIEFEVRVLVLGRSVRAVKVTNRSRHADIRLLLGTVNTVESFELPGDIREQCIRLVRQSGLVSASVDLAYLRSRVFTFLDLNPSGQFLWMEEFCPEIDVLDAFVKFILSGDPDYMEVPPSVHGKLTLSQFSFAPAEVHAG